MCANEAAIVDFVKEVTKELGYFRAVVEATVSYEWLIRLIEPLADKVILAHPGKLRVIAESTRKSDRLDAQILAEFLSREMVPASYRPPLVSASTVAWYVSRAPFNTGLLRSRIVCD